MNTQLNKIILTSDVKKKGNVNTIYIKKDINLNLYFHALKGSYYTDDELIKARFKELDKEDENKSLKRLISNRDEILRQFEKIPQIIKYKDLDSDVKKNKVDKEKVHKRKAQNVMIDEVGGLEELNLYVYIGNYKNTSEISLDHIHKDHVEAIYLSEICRQSGMDTVNKKIGVDTEYYITQEIKNYHNKVIRDKEVVVQTYPVIRNKRKGIGICFYSLFQNNQLCMNGYYLVVYSKEKK